MNAIKEGSHTFTLFLRLGEPNEKINDLLQTHLGRLAEKLGEKGEGATVTRLDHWTTRGKLVPKVASVIYELVETLDHVVSHANPTRETSQNLGEGLIKWEKWLLDIRSSGLTPQEKTS